MGPCNEVVFLGGVERRERSETTVGGGSRGSCSFEGCGRGGGGGRQGPPQGWLALCTLSMGQRVPLRGLMTMIQPRASCVGIPADAVRWDSCREPRRTLRTMNDERGGGLSFGGKKAVGQGGEWVSQTAGKTSAQTKNGKADVSISGCCTSKVGQEGLRGTPRDCLQWGPWLPLEQR